MTKKIFCTFFSILVAMVLEFPCEKAEATVVVFNPQMGYKVDIDDSTVRMKGRNRAWVVITPYYGEWGASYKVDVRWGAGFSVDRLNSHDDVWGREPDERLALAIANYMSENY